MVDISGSYIGTRSTTEAGQPHVERVLVGADDHSFVGKGFVGAFESCNDGELIPLKRHVNV